MDGPERRRPETASGSLAADHRAGDDQPDGPPSVASGHRCTVSFLDIGCTVVDGVRKTERRPTPRAFVAALYHGSPPVRNHVSNIFAKVQVADRTQAVSKAREAGLG